MLHKEVIYEPSLEAIIYEKWKRVPPLQRRVSFDFEPKRDAAIDARRSAAIFGRGFRVGEMVNEND